MAVFVVGIGRASHDCGNRMCVCVCVPAVVSDPSRLHLEKGLDRASGLRAMVARLTTLIIAIMAMDQFFTKRSL